MPESEQTQAQVNRKPKMKMPRILKNPVFIFTVSVILFLFALISLILIDTSFTFRPKWADFLCNWLASLGLAIDVHMITWGIFFIAFGLFFLFFFSGLFRKKLIKRAEERAARKHGEVSKGEKIAFSIVFWAILITIVGLIFAGGFIFLNVTGYMSTIIEQSKNLGPELLNTLLALGILLGLALAVPAAFAVLLLIFIVFIKVISIIVGGVSNSVMQSEGYQRNMAASQAAAADIERSMREAREKAGEAVKAVRDAMEGGGGRGSTSSPQADIIFPALTSIDKRWADKEEAAQKIEEARQAKLAELNKNLPKDSEPITKLPEEVEAEKNAETTARPPLDYEQFKLLAYEFQSYLCHQKYYFKINTLRSFIAGLAAARLILLQGLSGTGKSTLPRVFLEYVGGDAYFFPVQATWRDRSDITGYYSDFTGQFKETELLKHLYEASYIPETTNLMVLDEMNISRVEYYFADFLSIFEYPAEDWVVPLMQVKPGTVLPKYIENGMVRIPVNTWFVGTVNIDDSTFTITDKVYDRAIAIDFNELNLPFESSYRFDPHPIKVQELMAMFKECKEKPENNLTPAERKKFLDLTQFISETFDIQFGNRIMNQIDNFLPVFVGLGGSKVEALDTMVARKVLRKLEGKFESYIKDGLNKLTRYINANYGKHAFPESESVIEKYRRKLS